MEVIRSFDFGARYTTGRSLQRSRCCILCASAFRDTGLYLGSKALYAPMQDPSTYEPPPAGFTPIFTEMVARHGSRGLSSASNDLALYNMWLDAQSKGDLTKVGARLATDLLRIIQANALLGYNVPGITVPGYGNLTLVGIAEHTQLAQRLAARMSSLFSSVAATAGSSPRQIVVSTSGVNRAIDSSNYFLASLNNSVPGISSLIVNSPALTAYPVKPVAQAPGVNRFQLYIHKLAAKTDLPATDDPYYPVYQSSLQYQNFLASDPSMMNKVNSIVYSDSSFAPPAPYSIRSSRSFVRRSTTDPPPTPTTGHSRSLPPTANSPPPSRGMAER